MDSGIVIVSTTATGIVIYFWAMSILLRYVDEHSGEKAVLWVGLTENELSQIHNSANWNHDIDWSYERAIEAKLKEKNGE